MRRGLGAVGLLHLGNVETSSPESLGGAKAFPDKDGRQLCPDGLDVGSEPD